MKFFLIKNHLASISEKFDPTIECQHANKVMNTIQIMAYLSKLVKYETVGKDLFITHLNETEVNKSVYVVCSLEFGNLQSIENIVNDDAVIKNIRK